MSDANGAAVANAENATTEPADTSVDYTATASGGSDVRQAISGLNSVDADFYSTLTATSFAEKLALAKAINDSTPLDEALGVTFNLDQYIVQAVDIIDSNTGELVTAPRVTLIDDQGKAYHGTSKGLLTSIRNLNATIGDRSNWDGPIPIQVIKAGVRPRAYFTIKFL